MDENQTSYNLLLILPVALSAVWVILDLFYASWLLAFIANTLINAFLPKGTGIYIGRLKISLLTGRVVFKDVQYYDRDNSIFVTDGYGVLRWWKKPSTTDLPVKCKFCGSQSQAGADKKTSLIFLHLNGLEYHWYNRKDVYDEWGKPKTDENEVEGGGGGISSWIKQLRPSVHCTINKGRILFGNHFTETTLVLYFDHAEGQYRMTKASNDFDELMHSVRCHGDKLRAVLEPSHGYNGPRENIPPVTACTEVSDSGQTQGYLLLKTDSANVEYSVDIPGLVPLNDSSSPKFAFDVYLGPNSVLNYGTYANRQRINLIQKFFFPNDFTSRPVSRLPQPGERRIYTSFDVSVYIVSQATLNLFFEEKKDIRCLTFRIGGDSSLRINQPWVTKENGYTTILSAKATDLDVLTSLPYETLGRSQTFEMTTSLYFPRIWNVTQKWDMKFSLSHIQGSILFQYIDFFNALIDDWLGDNPPDLLEFVPVDWNIGIDIREYEIYLHTSPYNWIDITTEGKENSRLAFCGRTGHLAFEFPFTEFLPKVQRVTFTAHGQNIVLRKYIPPSCSSRDSQFQLSSNCKDRWRVMDPPQDRTPLVEKKLIRSYSQPLEIVKDPPTSEGGIEGSARTLGMHSSEIQYFKKTHIRRGSEPLLTKTSTQRKPLKDVGQMGLLLEETEESEAETQFASAVKTTETKGSKEFFPMGCRMETLHENGWLDIGCAPSITIEINYKGHNYDPTQSSDGRGEESRLVPNEVHVLVDASHILLRVFGSLAKDLISLRDNYPCEYMYFKTYFSESTSTPDGAVEKDVTHDLSKAPDTSLGPNVPKERFLNVIVDFKLHDVYGELPTHLPEGFPHDFPLISGMTDHFIVHMDYLEEEMRVNLHVDPITINLPFLSSKGSSSEHSLGYLLLSSIDFSCHGFTELLLEQRVEYAWLMKMEMGEIGGTVSAQQLIPVIDYFQTAANHVMSHGDDFCCAPDPVLVQPQAEPLSELIKYKLFALRVSTVEVNVKERDSLLKLKCPGFDLDLCNIHGHTQTLAISYRLQHLTAISFIAMPSNLSSLLECGRAEVGTIQGDVSLREPEKAMPERQMAFLKRADSRTRRLWFVWEEKYKNTCGCCGGCPFLSSTINRPDIDAKRPLEDSSYATSERLQVPSASIGGEDPSCSPALTTPFHNQAAFKSLQAIQNLHNSLVTYHSSGKLKNLQNFESTHQTPLHQMSSASLPSLNIVPEDSISRDSDSFHSANEFFEEDFQSVHNTPKASVKHTRQASKQSNQLTFQVPFTVEPVVKKKRTPLISNYAKILSSCDCCWKTIELFSKVISKETPPTERSQDLRSGATPRITPRRGRKRNEYGGPKFVLEIPEFVSSTEGCSPFVVRRHQQDQSASSGLRVSHLGHGSRDQPSEEGKAMFSVLVNITGSFNIFLSPPLIPVIERYIDCANVFFTTRSAQSLLEALALESLGSVESHLNKIAKSSLSSSTSPIPSSSVAPLAHFSLTMDPSAYGSVQVLQTSKILRPGQEAGATVTTDSGFDSRTSLVCLYTAGLQGNALIHHQSTKVSATCCEISEDAANIQTTLKLAGKFCLPVLQAGLFAISNYPQSMKGEAPSGIGSNYSFLDFYVEPSKPPDKNSPPVLITNVAELSMNKFLLTTAAKIIQHELSNNPILMWSDICDSVETPPKGVSEEGDQRNSELSNNSLVVNMSVPSVRLQLCGPKRGIPSCRELCVDSSLIFALVEVWKPLIEGLVGSVKEFWRNKLTRDRRLILTLVTAAMDVAYRPKLKNPLLTCVSRCLRETVTYAVTQQLWQGLPIATEERLLNFPSNYHEGFLLQEIVATLLCLALRLRVQDSPLSAIPCMEAFRPRTSYPQILTGIGYFSISPSPSELAVTNATYIQEDYVDRENIDYCSLVKGVDPTSLVYIREAMLPFFFACNVKMAPQLKTQCHNSLKLSVDYTIRLEEAAILVIDGREAHTHEADLIDDDSVGVVPEFLLEDLCLIGSLEHVVESRVIFQSSGRLVTIRPKTASSEGKKHRSNVTSKCHLGFNTIATHLTLPLLMLFRHTSESIGHWRKSFRAFKVSDNSPPLQESQLGGDQVSAEPDIVLSQTTLQSHSWVTAQSLVEMLTGMESKHLSSLAPTTPTATVAPLHSKQTTPKSSHKNLNISNYSTSPHFPISAKVAVSFGKTDELEEVETPLEKKSSHQRRSSLDSSTSVEPAESPPEVSITIQPPSNQVLEGVGSHGFGSSGSHGLELMEDTTDSPQVFSSDTEAPVQTSMATYATKKIPPPSINPVDFVPELSPVLEMPNMNEVLAIPDSQLEFSVYGSLRVKSLQISSQVETLFVMLEVRNISGAIDCRQIPSDKKSNVKAETTTSDHTPLLYKLLPTYLSVSSILQQCCIRVFDSAVSKGDLAVLSANPLELCTSLYYGDTQLAPAYRSLFRLPRVELDMKEPPIVLHKKFHKYIPTFTAIYNEVFTPSDSSINEMFFTTSTPSAVNVQDLQFPPHLPRGSFLFHLVWFRMIIRPLSSLTVKYELAPVTAQLGTSSVVKFSMNVGRHGLEFVPKESKDELSLRNIPLPIIALKGSVIPRPFSRLPSISAELAMKQVVIDVTTDVFNQLLILQTSFIKEINDLLNMFLNIGESIHVPQERLSSINFKQSTESGFELISLLSSIKLSLQGIKITVSTPTQTALRFSTGNKIEMLITNPSHQLTLNERPPVAQKDQLTLHGKVETEISISLGVLQDDTGIDEEDDFVELAYFKTWITIKNTLQQNTSLLTGMKESMDFPASLDTFHISIISPHLYIQSTAVEKAILFWVNCKSVYNYWQNEHKVLNAEVQAATEALVERITKPSTQIKTPSIDFSKPRLVQITVSDAGACMPLVSLPTTPHSSQKGFPALVFTIKDMQVTLNLSKRLGSTGKFSDFCVRFDEHFHFRHKTWTVDPKRFKSLDYGEVPNGTYRFCVVNKPRLENGGKGGEKLFSVFTWHMSGININSTTHIGRHISTLVKTLTAIGSDLDDSHQHESSSTPPTKAQFAPVLRSKRRYSYSFTEEQGFLRALEVDLAKQTRRLQKLRLSGATPDSLKNEEVTFHKLEVDIARGLRRVFRKGRTMSFQQWSQLLYPRSPVVGGTPKDLRKRLGSTSTLPRRKVVTFDESEMTPDPTTVHHPLGQSHSPRTHARHRSDITPDVKRLMKMEDDLEDTPLNSSAMGSLEEVEEGREEEEGDSESGPGEPLIPSIDIEINVTINVDSGQVKLYSEDLGAHEQRSSMLSLAATDSPRLGSRRSKQVTLSVLTTLFIPAVEVKAHYQSILGSTYSTAPTTPTKSPSSPQMTPQREKEEEDQRQKKPKMDSPPHVTFDINDNKVGLPVKKGVLSIATIISSLPNDLELNPSILDFVEQVVRPINISAQEIEIVSSDIKEEDEKEEDSKLPVTAQKSGTQPLSFPVDVRLNFQIHPSKIILTCNPHARVRCQIAIPAVGFMVSFMLFSRRQYDIPIPIPPQSKNESHLPQSPPDSSITSPNGSVQGGNDDIVTFNNLNITGCLQTFQLTMYTPNVQSSKLQQSSGQSSEEKEVISLVLGQAFIHLSRSSVSVHDGSPSKSVEDTISQEKLKVSVIPHIESLILFYDWRRLNDVTWFRKCWYHTGLVEALFIGKKPSEEPPQPHPPSPYDTNQQTIWSPGSSGEDSSTEPSTAETPTTITAELVVAVSVADMRLSANVAQLMGNAYIQASHLRGEAHADIKDNELVFFDADGTLEEFEIDAQGGVVAGNLKVKNTRLSLNSSSQIGCIPEHKAMGYIRSIHGHIDYMSAVIMLLKATELKVNVWDSWEGINQDRSEHTGAKIQVCCSFNWSTCQIAIHRATAKGMFGIVQRIYDFIIQQKKRSERTIGSMIPAGTTASTIFAAYQEEQKRAEKNRAAEIENPLLEYHHWVWAVRVGSIKLMNALGIQISTFQHDVSLGGFINVSGDNLTVVCFHGTSFRETEWAVFNIDLISAKFSTLAIPGLGVISEDLEDGHAAGKRRICKQECFLQLGNQSSKLTELAAVYRVTAGRGGVPPVSPAEISEWLNYACINHYFHSNQGAVTKPAGYIKESQKLSINPICCLPAFTVNLINDHLWPSLRELEDQVLSGMTESATVECTLVTTFSDGIAVTTTIENYLFLHDLFKAYIEYLEKQNVSFRPPFTTNPQSATFINVPEEERKTSNCLRRFVSVHWELDPRLVLLATAQWASGHFNPHVNWLLERLGFEHARTTIPKYIQRGLMDPLDLGIASIIELLIQLSAKKKVRTDDPSSD